MTPKLSRNKHVYTMAAGHAPAYEIGLGETVLVETWDAFGGRYTDPEGGTGVEDRANPATGPIAVRGIEAGDTVAVEILGISPLSPGILRTRELVKEIPIVGEHAFFDEWRWRLRPMIGVLGVAPAEGELDNHSPGEHGGNLDTNDVCAGATLHLRAQVQGGQLAMGDVHALMGEGESNGMGIEVGAHITLRVWKEDDPLTHHPYVVLDDKAIVIISAKTLDEAAWMAVDTMQQIVMERLQVAQDTARLLVGVLGQLRISQIVNPLKTVRMEMPLRRDGQRWYLPEHVA